MMLRKYVPQGISLSSFNLFQTRKLASEMPVPHSLGKYTMRYRSSETVQRSGYFQSSVSYIKVQIMLSREDNI